MDVKKPAAKSEPSIYIGRPKSIINKQQPKISTNYIYSIWVGKKTRADARKPHTEHNGDKSFLKFCLNEANVEALIIWHAILSNSFVFDRLSRFNSLTKRLHNFGRVFSMNFYKSDLSLSNKSSSRLLCTLYSSNRRYSSLLNQVQAICLHRAYLLSRVLHEYHAWY